MSTPYTYQVLKIAVAQICQNIGWYSITASSLELLIDVLDKYMREMCKTTHNYTELYNRTEANLDDLGLTFGELGINLSELEEYIQYVDPVVPATEIPKYPVKKESHLNFLKPGSKEVLTRPMHIHEHLPAIYPEDEEPSGSGLANDKDIDVVGTNEDSSNPVFKRPADASSDQNASKKQRVGFEEEGRPTREIISVMMTTSGFISPAREGKLPESKPPILPPEFKPTPPPAPPPTFTKPPSQNQPMPINSIEKKFEKKIRKKEKEKEKKKEKPPKELKTPKPELGPLPPLQMPPQIPLQHNQSIPQQLRMNSPSLPPQLPNHPPQFADIPGMPSVAQLFPGMSQKKIMALAKKAALGKKIPKKYKIKPNKMDMLPSMLKPEKKKPVGRPPKNPVAHAMSKYGMMGAVPPKPMMDTFGRDIQLPQQHGLLQPPPNFMPGQNFFSDSLKQPFPSQLQMLPNQPPIPPQSHPSLIEGKLVSEPDRNKLNIFKKISSSSKNKEDSNQKNFPTDSALDFPGSAKFDRPELDIFRTGQNPGVPQNLDFMMTKIPKKHKTPKSHHQQMPVSHAQMLHTSQQANEMPLNMSMSKSSDFSVDDLTIPKTPSFPRTPDLKLDKKEKKKRKEKEKKMKELEWPPKLSTLFNQNASSSSEAGPSNQNPFLQKSQDAASILQSAGITPAQQNLFLPFPNLFFPGASGPGLIPNLSAFNPLSAGPFGLPGSSLGIPGGDLNLRKFQKPSKKQEKKDAFGKMQSLSKPDKTFCNVAPLVPPSIIDSVKPRILDLPLGAEKLPSATQITPIKSFQPDKGFDIFKSTSITPSNLTSTPNIKSETFVNRQQEAVMTCDLTSSPEPNIPPSKPKSPPPSLTITPAQPIQHQLTIPPQKIKDLKATSVSINTPLPSATDESVFIPSIDNLPMSLNVMASPKIKDKSEKKKDKEHKKEMKDKEGKIKKKKAKKDKNKNKEGKEERKDKKEKRDKEGKEKSKKDKKEKRREKERASSVPDSQSQSASANDTDTADNVSTSSVPKLTLKLGNSPRPLTPDVYKKISKVKKDDYEFSSPSSSQTYGSLDTNLMKEDNSEVAMLGRDREASPELAKISALITRPPKQKPSKRKDDERSPKLSGAETDESPSKDGLKPAKQPKLNPGMGSGSNTPSDGNVKASSDILTSPGKHSKKKPGNMSDNVRDVDGNEVWICPACGQIDDGSPMIGCDGGCESWYHWVCVGIQIPPDANEDWYCRVCISKKQEGDEKKKKRKKKDKKEH